MADKTPHLAIYACASCRQRKRKCDKLLPRCSLCAKKNVACLYSTLNIPQPLSQLGGFLHYETPTIQTPRFPAVFFLDSGLFQKAQIDIPRSEAPIPRYVLDLIGDSSQWRSIAAKFFETVHTFMPIVSKVKFYKKLLNPLATLRSDAALLLLSMRCITMLPAETPMSRTPEYLAARKFHVELEVAGGFSPQVMQAGVFIALYEYGHAIYPAAYLTIGALARYGISSGLDGTGTSQMTPPGDWIEAEERVRTWWAVLILDRSVNLGNPTRSLATPEPHLSSILPMDDELWDQGIPPSSEPFTLSSPSSLTTGRYAAFSQTVFLLGRVYKHVSDFTTNKDFLNEEATQLRRTLQALAKIVDIEGQAQNKKLQFCTQAAICYRQIIQLTSLLITPS
ncbi:putative fungal-specific transcription factor [Stipitochalara longipes BDJ]|nr:putative fungal-specific transcription factor [Stipitochalara longipes BDJ]